MRTGTRFIEWAGDFEYPGGFKLHSNTAKEITLSMAHHEQRGQGTMVFLARVVYL